MTHEGVIASEREHGITYCIFHNSWAIALERYSLIHILFLWPKMLCIVRMYYSTGYPCFPSIVNTNKLYRSRVVVNEIFVSFNTRVLGHSWLTYPRWPFSSFHSHKAGNLRDTQIATFFNIMEIQSAHFWALFFSFFFHTFLRLLSFWSKDRKINFVETGWGQSIHAAQYVCSDFCCTSPPMWWCEMPQMWKKGEQIWTLCVPNRKWDIGNRLFATRAAETHLMLRRTEAANF